MWGEQAWGVRRLLTHIKGLPPDSAYVRSQMKSPLGWGNDVEMLATVVDSVRYLTDLFISANSESKQDPSPRVPRPYEAALEPVKAPTIQLSQFASMMED
ncbi:MULTISPECIES: hypothetical protein [unclassified Cryobacterium]|uniref:hypothetical protein n=1 Tax=unclassified Cryobacterium TaxID=2649013 RepID=UPI00106D5D34|nr:MULTISPECIES: hypothetical protein [unclassified Cryobacterium]TFB96523.1 hypothetical protein E3O39_10650 [Cryobacterium sp. MDB2-A-1]TFC12808.1 hypothetical protein E3O35_07815 [Cryobacterium sp. MDB2-A-2]